MEQFSASPFVSIAAFGILLVVCCSRAPTDSEIGRYEWHVAPNVNLKPGQPVAWVLELLPHRRFRQTFVVDDPLMSDLTIRDTMLTWGVYEHHADSVRFFIDSARTIGSASAHPMREWLGGGRVAADSFIDAPDYDMFPHGPPAVLLRVRH